MSDSVSNIPEKEKKAEEQIIKGNENFNDLAIELFGDRISQEFDNISGNETKASILIATCVALFAIFSIPNTSINLTGFLAKTIGNQIVVIFIWSSFAFTFLVALIVVFPASKLRAIKPRNWNNKLAVMNLKESKAMIKEDLIKNFEYIHEHRLRDVKCLRTGFISLAVGFAAMLIGMIFYQ